MRESNILIAEFMGLAHQLGMYEDPETGEYVYPEDLKYHNNWSWLMPVIEKISSLRNHFYPEGIYKYLVNVNLCVGTKCITIEDMYEEDRIKIEYYEDSLIENIYKAVVTFIKWYNQNKICE